MKEEYMTIAATPPGTNGRSRPSLGDQLDRLDRILNGLSDALNESVTAAVSAAVGKALREGVESATRELAARSTPTATITDREVSTGTRPRLRLLKGARATARRTFAAAARGTIRLYRRLGAPVVAPLRRMKRSPRRFVALVLAGVVGGVAAGVSGPLMGGVLGGLAGYVAALSGSPRG
jgi:hypothetical protein